MSKALPNKLLTERLILRKPELKDAEELFKAYTSDSEVTKYLTWRVHSSVEETQKFVGYCIDKWENDGEYNYVICSKVRENIIGMIKVTIKEDNSAAIGYVLAKSEWGKGYTTEAFKKMVEFLFNETDVNKVRSFCDIENKASAKVMEKAGLKYSKTLKSAVVHPSISLAPRDALYYELVRSDYINP